MITIQAQMALAIVGRRFAAPAPVCAPRWRPGGGSKSTSPLAGRGTFRPARAEHIMGREHRCERSRWRSSRGACWLRRWHRRPEPVRRRSPMTRSWTRSSRSAVRWHRRRPHQPRRHRPARTRTSRCSRIRPRSTSPAGTATSRRRATSEPPERRLPHLPDPRRGRAGRHARFQRHARHRPGRRRLRHPAQPERQAADPRHALARRRRRRGRRAERRGRRLDPASRRDRDRRRA